MNKYIFKCKTPCDAIPCKVMFKGIVQPDFPHCPYGNKDAEFKLKIKVVAK